MGWAARTYASRCPYSSTAFMLQISVLILGMFRFQPNVMNAEKLKPISAPCFFSAGIYYILGQLIKQFGRQYSPLSARNYLIIFITFDILSIVIQAIGGALASKHSASSLGISTAQSSYRRDGKDTSSHMSHTSVF